MREAQAEFVTPPSGFATRVRQLLIQRNRFALEFAQSLRPVFELGAKSLDALLEPLHQREALVPTLSTQNVFEHGKVIDDAGPQCIREKRRVKSFEAALFQSPQAAHQVAVINRRNKSRLNWFEGTRIIPIEELPVHPRQPIDRFERLLGVGDKFRQREKSEV